MHLPHSPSKQHHPTAAYGNKAGSRLLEVLSLLGIVAGVILLWSAWPELPEKVPSHFNLSGQPDGWAGKSILYLFIAVPLFICGLMTAVNRGNIRPSNAKDLPPEAVAEATTIMRTFLNMLKAELIWFFVLIEWRTLDVALGKADGLGVWFVPSLISLILVSVAVFLRRMAALVKRYRLKE